MKEIEESVFLRKKWDEEKMLTRGFRSDKDAYTLEESFFKGDFRAILTVTKKGVLSGNVVDEMTKDAYCQIHQENANGAYVHRVRNAYRALLEDIADSCCIDVLFSSPQANRIADHILSQFSVKPDFPWEKHARYQSYGTFRHTSNRKWFALIMNIKRSTLDKDDNPSPVDILNVKIQPEKGASLRQLPGIYPAYHMNHTNWISITLDDVLSDEEIIPMVEESHRLTRSIP